MSNFSCCSVWSYPQIVMRTGKSKGVLGRLAGNCLPYSMSYRYEIHRVWACFQNKTKKTEFQQKFLLSPKLIILQNWDLLKHFTLTVLFSLTHVWRVEQALSSFQYPLRPRILLSQVNCAIPKIRLCSFKDAHSQESCNFLDGIQRLVYVFQPFNLYLSASVSVLVNIVTRFVCFPFVFSRCAAVVFDPYRVHGLLWRVYDFSRIFDFSLFCWYVCSD